MSSNLSLDSEIDKRITKAAAVLSKLSQRLWENSQLTLNTKLKVYHASSVPYCTAASLVRNTLDRVAADLFQELEQATPAHKVKSLVRSMHVT